MMRKTMPILFWIVLFANITYAQYPSWRMLPSFPNLPIIALASDSSGRLFASTTAGLFRSIDGGVAWDSISAGGFIAVRNSYEIVRISSGRFASTTFSTSYDHGATWDDDRVVDRNNPEFEPQSLSVAPDGSIYVTGIDGNLYRLRDGASQWERLSVQEGIMDIYTMAFLSPSIAFAGTSLGLFRTVDEGKTWSRVNGGWEEESAVRAIAVGNDGMVFIGTMGDGAYYSQNGEDNWSRVTIDGPLKSAIVSTIAVSSKGSVIVGADYDGVFGSPTGRGEWRSANVGIDSADVRFAAIVIASDGYAYAAYDQQGGLYKSEGRVAGPVAGVKIPSPASDTKLVCWPNPVVTRSTVGYELHGAGNVRLTMFNGVGRSSAILYEGFQNGGEHAMSLAAASLANGEYYCQVTLNGVPVGLIPVVVAGASN